VSTTFVAVEPRWWVSNFGGMVLSGVTAARSRSKWVRRGYALALALHVGEATYAYVTAVRVGYDDDAWKWGLQTLGVGFPSVRALNALIAEQVAEPR
jgi:hypothetical protein